MDFTLTRAHPFLPKRYGMAESPTRKGYIDRFVTKREIPKRSLEMVCLEKKTVNFFRASTLPETNIAPENRPLSKGYSYWKPPLPGAMLVSGRVLLRHVPFITRSGASLQTLPVPNHRRRNYVKTSLGCRGKRNR